MKIIHMLKQAACTVVGAVVLAVALVAAVIGLLLGDRSITLFPPEDKP